MIVEAVGLGAWVEGREVLRGIDLGVEPGECVALVGPNGAGKTTLLRVLATLLPVGAGELRLFGRPVRRSEASVRARVGMIGHKPMLYAALTVRENLELFARLYGVARAAARAQEAAEMAGVSGEAGLPVGSLSRGMAQRAAIARALIHDPELLLADEPWTGLDTQTSEMLNGVFRELRERGRTVVVASHDIGRSLGLADRVVALRDGGVALDRDAPGCDAGAVAEALSAAPEASGVGR